MRLTFGLIIFFLCTGLTWAQRSDSLDIIGQVIDTKEKTPVVFATLQFKKNNKGMITDEDGYFRLPKSQMQKTDTLLISSIGYETKELPIDQLQDSIINRIGLMPKIEALEGVVLLGNKKTRISQTGFSIVKKAIARIPQNYPAFPFSFIGYYRDYQLVQQQYFNLNEAVVEVFDGGFQTDQLFDNNNQTLLRNYKRNTDFPQDKRLAQSYAEEGKYINNAKISDMGGNELSILNLHNPIRNYQRLSFSFVNVFQTDFLLNHSFKAQKVTYLNDIPLYEIDFKYFKPGSNVQYTVEGKIYVGLENFAIHKLEYFLKERSQPKYALRLEYAPRGEHMYLNYISFNNYFKAEDPDAFDIEKVTLDLDQNAFLISFTNPVNENSLKELKNFRFLYKKRKLSIATISLQQPKVMKVALVEGTIPAEQKSGEELLKDITYKIKKVVDIKGRKLGKRKSITANQFRELFVQEVFPSKTLPQKNVFLHKTRPLNLAIIDSTLASEAYWINTPLNSKTYQE